MKDICAWIICFCITISGSCYVFQIWRRKAVPTTSTWMIFWVGSGLSFLSYLIAENREWKSGILNMADVVYITVVLAAIFLWTEHRVCFEPFERWYLAGAGLIFVYGVVTGNAWNSNVLTQILMSLAYFPMFHKLLVEKKKTDSYFAWVPPSFAAAVALYLSISEWNTLAIIYSARSLFFTLTTTLMMLHYQIKAKKATSAV